MNKLFSWTLLFIVIATILSLNLVSCANDEPEMSDTISKEDLEFFETVSNAVDNILDTSPDASYEEIISKLSEYSSKVSFLIEDSVLYIQTPGEMEIQVDRYGLFLLGESDEVDIDDKIIGLIIDSINASLDSINYNIDVDETFIKSQTRASQNTDDRILTTKKILLWAPWNTGLKNLTKVIPEIAEKNNLIYKQIIRNACTLESMKNFSDYDIVVLACHGTRRGELCLPYSKALVNTFISNKLKIITGYAGKNKEKCLILSNTHLTKYMPKMKNTILWTIMCHAGIQKSIIKQVAVNHSNVADFIGANNIICDSVAVEHLQVFLTKLYNGMTSQDAFRFSKNQSSRPYSYYSKDSKNTIKGHYIETTLNKVYFQQPIAQKPSQNIPKTKIVLPAGVMSKIRLSPSTRSSNDNETSVDAGFWFKNIDTGKETLIPYSSSVLNKVGESHYKDLIDCYIFECSTDCLDDGRYQYRTYLTTDGTTVYSDSTYTFTKAKVAYSVFNGGVVTLYYDDKKYSREGTIFPVQNGEPILKDNQNMTITHIIFDKSFSGFRPNSTAHWFKSCVNLKLIEGLNNLNTINVTDMSKMFFNCNSLTSLNLSSFNTSNVSNMEYMFGQCWSLTSLNLSSFNTSKVTNMEHMFRLCSSLTSLNLSSFNTSKVTNMEYMFEECSSLTTLSLSSFRTGNVNNMRFMFELCHSLKSLNLRNFDTRNVTDMTGMFNECSSMTNLNVSSFNTSKVTKMSFMFNHCSSLTELDIKNFNTGNVIWLNSMFQGCSSLKSLDVSNFNTKNALYFADMFAGCSSLNDINVRNFNTDKVKDLTGMFGGCSSLKTLDLRNFNINLIEEEGLGYSYVFSDCKNLRTIYAKNWKYNKNSNKMFNGCDNLVGGKGSKLGYNYYYTADGQQLYFYVGDDGSSAHIDKGMDDPGLFTE